MSSRRVIKAWACWGKIVHRFVRVIMLMAFRVIMLMIVRLSMPVSVQMMVRVIRLMRMRVIEVMIVGVMIRMVRIMAVDMGMPMPMIRPRGPHISGGGGHELAMLDPFGPQEGVCNGADAGTAPPHDDHFETIATIQVNVHRGHDLVDILMLDGIEPVGKLGLVMVEDHGDSPRDLGVRVLHPMLH